MIKIGVNGFGRIGKCIFLQLLCKKNVQICAINDPNIKVNDIEDYLKYDSVHNYNKNWFNLKKKITNKRYAKVLKIFYF